MLLAVICPQKSHLNVGRPLDRFHVLNWPVSSIIINGFFIIIFRYGLVDTGDVGNNVLGLSVIKKDIKPPHLFLCYWKLEVQIHGKSVGCLVHLIVGIPDRWKKVSDFPLAVFIVSGWRRVTGSQFWQKTGVTTDMAVGQLGRFF